MTRQFEYALEPVRLQRTWKRSELQMQLAEQNMKLARQEQAISDLQGQVEAGLMEWRNLTVPMQVLRPEALAAYAGYLAQLGRKIHDAQATCTSIEQERERIAALLAWAMRELDAVERHKTDRHTDYRFEQHKADGIEADDHWSILKNRSTHVGQT